MRIFTHSVVSLDAVCSVWAARQFVPGAENATVEFRSVNWDGRGMAEDDLAVALDAGGRGLKSKKGENGLVHSCFDRLLSQYATPSDQEALAGLVRFVNAQDTYGSAVTFLAPEIRSKESQRILSATGLGGVLRALQEVNVGRDDIVVGRMSEILSGLFQIEQSRGRALAEADRAQTLGGKVAIVVNSQEFATNNILFERGVRVIVYANGHNLGIIRHGNETLRADHPEFRAIVEAAGEADEWFALSNGYTFYRGTRDTPSKVRPRDLAEVAVRLLV